MRQGRTKALWTSAFVLFLAAIIAVAAALTLSPTGSLPEEGIIFLVESGWSGRVIAERLESVKAIRSSFAFEALARFAYGASGMKAGAYRILPNFDAIKICDMMASGEQLLVRVTIPEGWTLSRIATRLSEEGICQAEAFKSVATDPHFSAMLGFGSWGLQGFLFPDTYFLSPGSEPSSVAQAMTAAFRKRLDDIPEAKGLEPGVLREKVTLASIVEREYRVPEEAPLIASVFQNRIARGMRLQSCATVVYVITEELGGDHPDTIYTKDLELASEYNTYLHKGLPPGPIANPGLTALLSAFRPASSPYLYFVVKDPEAGTHVFSESLDEHIQAKYLYVKRVGRK